MMAAPARAAASVSATEALAKSKSPAVAGRCEGGCLIVCRGADKAVCSLAALIRVRRPRCGGLRRALSMYQKFG
jgi:hypothetical protein